MQAQDWVSLSDQEAVKVVHLLTDTHLQETPELGRPVGEERTGRDEGIALSILFLLFGLVVVTRDMV